MFNNANNQGFGGYPGYVQPGMQYAQKPTAKMTQTLTPEQIKKLRGSGNTFDLHISQPEMWKAICTHKENGNIVLTENADGSWTCPICGATFTMSYTDKGKVEEAVNIVVDILQTVKTLYLDIPEEMATQYFQIIPILNKLPALYEIAQNNFNMYDTSSTVNPGGSMYGFNALNAFTSPAFAMPGMMGANPAMNPYYQQQPNYVPQPGMMYQQPVGNPFGYNAPVAQPQEAIAQQPVADSTQASTPAPAADVNQQRVFNV